MACREKDAALSKLDNIFPVKLHQVTMKTPKNVFVLSMHPSATKFHLNDAYCAITIPERRAI